MTAALNRALHPVIAQAPLLLSGGGGGDPFWANVNYLVKGDGVHGDPLALVDFAGIHGSFTYSGTPPTYSNVQAKPWATTSMRFNSANSQFARTTIGAALAAVGSADWTVEHWVFPLSNLNAPSMNIGRYAAASIDLWIGDTTLNYFALMWLSTATNRWLITEQISGPFTLNAWHHVALARDSGTLRCFIDGVQVGGDQVDAGDFPNVDTNGITLGGDESAFGFVQNCYIQEARVTAGVARYVSNFTPPTISFPEGP
jgi:hypothetical protein